MNTKHWAIIGAGNGGQTMAGHLAIMGVPVKIFDVYEKTVNAINENKGIELEGKINGFGKIIEATTEIDKVVKNAEIIIVVLPAIYHKSIAEKCSKFLEEGQIIILHPEASLGAVEFKKIIDKERENIDITVGATNTLLYACRAEKPGLAHVFGKKNEIKMATIPTEKGKSTLELLKGYFPEIKLVKNVLETSLSNLNAMVHPGPSLLNTSLIESNHSFEYYLDGFTPSIANFVEKLDKERVLIADAYGIRLKGIKEEFKSIYGSEGDTLYEIIQNTEVYKGIMGQNKMNNRYLTEDIPFSLVSMKTLAEVADVNIKYIKTIIDLGEGVLGEILETGRTRENLELESSNIDDLINYVELG